MRIARAFAPAKINLFLHVGATGADGYHPLTSWMVFADLGDHLTLTDSGEMEFAVEGPFAGALKGGAENIAVRARDRVVEAAPNALAPFRLMLDKQLPVASGMGGGSSDAAATLRLLGEVAGVPLETLRGLAAGLGSDVPACLEARSVMARGRGDLLSPAPVIPPLPVVLVNPGVAVSTREIFTDFDAGTPGDLSDGDPPAAFATVQDVADFLSVQRNDLAAPAVASQPVIGEVMAALQAAPQTLLARMSGSGATVFSLCETTADASALAASIAADHPGWWVRACSLS